MIAADAGCAVIFSLSPGQAGDAPEGRKMLTELGAASKPCAMIMDRAYEGDETRNLLSELGFSPVVPPKSSRTEPWEYDKELYKKRNEVEWLFRRLKGFCRIFTRFDKLDRMFMRVRRSCFDRDSTQTVFAPPFCISLFLPTLLPEKHECGHLGADQTPCRGLCRLSPAATIKEQP